MGIFHSYISLPEGRISCNFNRLIWGTNDFHSKKQRCRNMSQDMDVFSCYPPFGGCVQWPYGGRVKHPPKSHEKSVAGCDQSLWCGCLLREHEQPWRRIAILLDSRIWYMDMIYDIYIHIYIYIYIIILYIYIYYITLYIVYIYIICVCVSYK